MGFSAGLAFVIAVTAWVGAAQAQSFNCRYAHYADEKLICARPELAQLDNELASVFGRAMRRLPARQQHLLDAAEDGWVVERRGCGGDFACIAEQYRRRIEHLSRIAARDGDRFQREAHPEAAVPPPGFAANPPAQGPEKAPQPRPSKPSQAAVPAPTQRPRHPVNEGSSVPPPAAAVRTLPEPAKTAVRPAPAPPAGSPGTTSGPTIRWANPPPEH